MADKNLFLVEDKGEVISIKNEINHLVGDRLKKAKAQHPELAEVIFEGDRAGRPAQLQKELEKVCGELKMTLKEEGGAKAK